MAEKIKTVDGQTLLNMDLPPIQFIVEGLLPQGLHIFAGTAKTGKSWLLLLLSLKISKGEPFWHLRTSQGTVLSLCLEDSLSRIQQRLSELTDEAPSNLFFSTLSKSLNDGLPEQIESFIAEHSDTKLVVIDTLQMVRQSSADSNMYAADYKDIGMLKQLTDKYGIAIIVVQHLRKQRDSDPHAMISGSTGLVGAADGSYVLKRENADDKEAKLYIRGRDVEELVLTIRRDDETKEWIFVSSDSPIADTVSNDDVIPKLIDYIKREKDFCGTASELIQRLDCKISGNSLSRKLTKYENHLKENGIEFVKSRTGERREIMIVYSPNDDMTIKNFSSQNDCKNPQSIS